MATIKVAIADDHMLFRRGMISLLESEDNIEVVLEANNGQELLQRIKGVGADVVLMDVEMPVMDGIQATKQLLLEFPEIRVVMLSAHNEKSMILHAIDLGARGYLLKDSEPDEVIDAINTVVQNGFCFNKDISNLLLKSIVQKDKLTSTFNSAPQLTERELEILQMICQELTNAEIADKLFISPRTVETHRKTIMEKIGARNAVGLVMYALKNKLVQL